MGRQSYRAQRIASVDGGVGYNREGNPSPSGYSKRDIGTDRMLYYEGSELSMRAGNETDGLQMARKPSHKAAGRPIYYTSHLRCV